MARRSRLPDGYVVGEGCHNCRRVFIKSECDGETMLFCRYRAGRRPRCGSVAMNECFGSDRPLSLTDKTWRAAMKRWDDWAEGRLVDEAGWCPQWRERDAKDEA